MKSLSKRALIQLPPEAPQMWRWVEYMYASRLLSNFQKPFISNKKREKIEEYLNKKSVEIENLCYSNELMQLENQQQEEEFVKKHNLNEIETYEPSGIVFSKGILRISPEHPSYSKSPIWKVALFIEPFLDTGITLREDLTLLQALQFTYLYMRRHVPHEALSDEQLVEYTMLKNNIQKDAGKPIQALHKYTKAVINFNMYGINSEEMVNLEIKETLKEDIYGEFLKPNTIFIYVWYEELHVKSIDEYVKNKKRLQQTLYHEIRHWIQEVISKNKNVPAGLPKYKDVNYTPEGFHSQDKQLAKSIFNKIHQNQTFSDEDVINLDYLIENRLPHALRQEEFHTRLADEVNRFNNLNIPKNQLKNAAKAYIGIIPYFQFQEELILPTEFFRALKENAKYSFLGKKLYHYAIKLFIKEIL